MTSLQPSQSGPVIGEKRKRKGDPKFYAVRIGHKPGIYHTWAECLAQVRGVRSAAYKSFPTISEAEAFLRNERTGDPQKFYAVRHGRIPGIYTDWYTASKQIEGWTKPQHKSFHTRAEAQEFMRAAPSNLKGPAQDSSAGPKAKKQKRPPAPEPREVDPTVEPGTGALPAGSEDGFDARLILDEETGRLRYKTDAQRAATRMQPVGVREGAALHIYTDGAALGNGQPGSTAGIGIWFGPSHPSNVSEPLPGDRQTNQRAELMAIKRAIDLSPFDRDVVIYSDSKYAILCVTEWFVGWRRNGWLNAHKKPVENRDLIEPILAKIEERHVKRAKTEFTWVKGHNANAGNEGADELAVQAAVEAKQSLARV